jgi:hypothetical protein
MRVIPSLALLITVAAGASVVLAFLQWVDFGITETRGTDADAATGISDGWFVAGLGIAIVLLAGGVLFRQQMSFVLLPMIAIAAIVILGIAGFDSVTNWHAAGVNRDNPGIFVQSQGDPTVVPYAISALAILIALSAAIIRGLQIREDSRLPYESNLDREVSGSID